MTSLYFLKIATTLADLGLSAVRRSAHWRGSRPGRRRPERPPSFPWGRLSLISRIRPPARPVRARCRRVGRKVNSAVRSRGIAWTEYTPATNRRQKIIFQWPRQAARMAQEARLIFPRWGGGPQKAAKPPKGEVFVGRIVGVLGYEMLTR